MKKLEEKAKLKERIADFYYRLSVLRKNNAKPSKSMSFIFDSSNRLMDTLLQEFSLKDIAIADIGGGTGDFLFDHSKSFTRNSKITLIDISPAQINNAKKRYQKDYVGSFSFKTKVSDVDDLGIKNEFDMIFFRSILEHLYFPEKAVKNLSTALKKSGLLFIITPNRNRLNERIKRLIPKKLRNRLKLKYGTDVSDTLLLEDKMNLKEHIHEYTLKEIKLLLEKNNLEIIRVKYSTIPFVVPSICDKYSFIFNIQKAIISFFNLLGLNRFLGFDFVVLARKRPN